MADETRDAATRFDSARRKVGMLLDGLRSPEREEGLAANAGI